MARFEGRREDAEMMQVLRGKSRRRRTDFDGFSDIGAASQVMVAEQGAPLLQL